MRADRGGGDLEASVGADGPAGDVVASGDRGGEGLAGHHAGVDGGGPTADDAVGGDGLTGEDDEDVSGSERARGLDGLDAVAEDADVGRGEGVEGAEDVAGLAARAGLEVAAGELEGGHPGGDIEVDRVRPGGREAEAQPVPALVVAEAEQQRRHGPSERGGDTEGHERIHADHAVSEVAERGPMEGPGGPGHDRQREQHADPFPSREPPARNEGEHDREVHQRHGEQRGEHQAATQRGDPVLGGACGPGVVGAFADMRPVSGVLNLLDGARRLGQRQAGDHRAFGGVVDGRGHPLELVQGPLDAAGAGRARHPGDVELERLDDWCRSGGEGHGAGSSGRGCSGRAVAVSRSLRRCSIRL